MCSQDANDKSNGAMEIARGSSLLESLDEERNKPQPSTSAPTAEFERLLVAPPLYPPLLHGPLPRPIGYTDDDAIEILPSNGPTVSSDRRNVPRHFGLRDPRLNYHRYSNQSNSHQSAEQTSSAAQSNGQPSQQETTSFGDSATSSVRSSAQSQQPISQPSPLTSDASANRPRTPQPVPPYDPEAFARHLEHTIGPRLTARNRTLQRYSPYATPRQNQSASSSNSQAIYDNPLNPRFSPLRNVKSTPPTPLPSIIPKRPSSVRSANQRPSGYRPRSPQRPTYAPSDFCWDWDTPLARPPKRQLDTQSVCSRGRSLTPSAQRYRREPDRQFFNGSAYTHYQHQPNGRHRSNTPSQLNGRQESNDQYQTNGRFQSNENSQQNGRQTSLARAQQPGRYRPNTPHHIPEVITLSSDEEPDIIVLTPKR
ncbi:hypothetical protein M3Y95_01032900 [Aphelenchoides besseyi]|nr:hypothetical protein M3Y95_01032900 [Aphelenchoides besseyi]